MNSPDPPPAADASPWPPPRPYAGPAGERSLPPPAPPNPPRPDYDTAKRIRARPPAFFWVAMAGAAVVMVGAFLPWVSANAVFFGRIETRGIEGDGVATLVLGVVVGFIALARFRIDDRARSVAIVGIVCSLLVIVVGVWDFLDTQRRVRDLNQSIAGFGQASVGIGLYLTIAGGVAMLLATASAERLSRHRDE
jgi:hypothetical protein